LVARSQHERRLRSRHGPMTWGVPTHTSEMSS
jgi:hypothetical protein